MKQRKRSKQAKAQLTELGYRKRGKRYVNAKTGRFVKAETAEQYLSFLGIRLDARNRPIDARTGKQLGAVRLDRKGSLVNKQGKRVKRGLLAKPRKTPKTRVFKTIKPKETGEFEGLKVVKRIGNIEVCELHQKNITFNLYRFKRGKRKVRVDGSVPSRYEGTGVIPVETQTVSIKDMDLTDDDITERTKKLLAIVKQEEGSNAIGSQIMRILKLPTFESDIRNLDFGWDSTVFAKHNELERMALEKTTEYLTSNGARAERYVAKAFVNVSIKTLSAKMRKAWDKKWQARGKRLIEKYNSTMQKSAKSAKRAR